MKKQENVEKSFKVPGGLVIPIFGIGSIIWLLTSLSKGEIIATLIFIGIVSVIYFVMKWIKKRYKKQ